MDNNHGVKTHKVIVKGEDFDYLGSNNFDFLEGFSTTTTK